MNVINTTTECPHHRAMRLNQTMNSSVIVDHSGHNMGGGGGSGGGHNHNMMGDSDDMMYMYFHGGINDTILFDFWRPKTLTIFLLSCFILFVCAALYEGLKLLRENLIRNELNRQSNARKEYKLNKDNTKTLINNNNNNDTTDELILNLTNNNNNSTNINENQIKIFLKGNRLLSRGHILQTFLHMFQVTISYLLMLVFMTYNTWLCLSVVLGAGVGYFFFGYKRITTIDANEHCH